ncbi:MAG TPA: hypothetical protein VFR39_06860 [Burkholderiales bacterium]|nr:hypothetical protein [Burkholderiales bacterium]
MKLSRMAAFTTGILLAGSLAALAAETTPASATKVEDKLVSEFAIFAGSQDNSRSLVTGLRQGSEVTLVNDGPAGGGATVPPTTRPMGYGNVRISLALAQEQLIRAGITQPTAEQLRASLVGGTVANNSGQTTELQGVLQMRADGMGWGRIANEMGTKLGHVMSGLKQTNQQLAKGQPVPGAGTAGSAGITTAAGTRGGATTSRGNGRGSQARADQQVGAGIVTAAGGPVATGARVQSGGDVRATGVVTGAGTAAGSNASATGLGNGKGHAKP